MPAEPDPPVVDLPRFAAEVRASVPDDDHAFEQFERVLERWRQRFYKARAAARYEERRFHDSGLITARRQGSYITASAALRILDLGAGIVLLVNAHRAHPAFAAARSLVETTASLCYLQDEVSPRIAKGRVAQVDETLRRLRVGLDPGASADSERRQFPIKPIPVSSLINALTRQVDAILAGDEEESAGRTMSRLYSVLSDHAHPNHSSQHLSVSIDEDWMMDWAFDHEWDPDTIHNVLGTTYLALHFGGLASDNFSATLTKHPMVIADKARDRSRQIEIDESR